MHYIGFISVLADIQNYDVGIGHKKVVSLVWDARPVAMGHKLCPQLELGSHYRQRGRIYCGGMCHLKIISACSFLDFILIHLFPVSPIHSLYRLYGNNGKSQFGGLKICFVQVML